MHRGFIKLWRKVKDTKFFQDSEAVHLWIYILVSADYKTGVLKESLRTIEKSTGIDKSKIKRILEFFKSDSVIETVNETVKNYQITVIKLVNYKQYNETVNIEQSETVLKLLRSSKKFKKTFNTTKDNQTDTVKYNNNTTRKARFY